MGKPPEDGRNTTPSIGPATVSGPPPEEFPAAAEHQPRLTMDPRVGTVLSDRYMVMKRLGQGGMARVYLARHQIIGRSVAIKVLLPHLVEDALIVRRFVNEARAAGMIGHPNIVESVDIGTTDDGLPFLVLEYLEGTSLSDEVVRVGPMPVERAVGIALQIASALAAAHAQSIIHRDLKSENVYLVERDGRADHVKVLDFGVSKFAGGVKDQKSLTAQGSVLGTPECMAPEQFIDPDSVDARIDVYALGVLLYELLGGKTPFHGIPFPKVLHSIVHEVPAPLTQKRPDVPTELDALVQRAMAKSRDDRPASMDELYEMLLPFAGKAPPPKFVARPSTPDGAGIPMTYRLPPRGAQSTALKASAPAESSADRTMVSGPHALGLGATQRDGAAPPPVRVVGAAAPHGTDGRSTASATSAPATPQRERAGSRLSIFVALAIVLIGAPATYFALRSAGKTSTEGSSTTPTPPPPASGTGSATIAASTTTNMTASASDKPAGASATTTVLPASSVALAVLCPLPGARVTFRGRTTALPFTDIVSAGTQTEPIEVSAEGHEGRRYFVRVDHPMSVTAKLPTGKAIVVDATAAETSAALSGGAPEIQKFPGAPTTSAKASASGKPTDDITFDR